jgi:hypothetical protein
VGIAICNACSKNPDAEIGEKLGFGGRFCLDRVLLIGLGDINIADLAESISSLASLEDPDHCLASRRLSCFLRLLLHRQQHRHPLLLARAAAWKHGRILQNEGGQTWLWSGSNAKDYYQSFDYLY